jgi:hypothetical protein
MYYGFCALLRSGIATFNGVIMASWRIAARKTTFHFFMVEMLVS